MSSTNKRNAKDATSLEKRYEEAMESNNHARQVQLEILRYRSKVEAVLELPGTTNDRFQFLAYLDLLRYRKEHQQIEIVKHYLSDLKNTPAAQNEEQLPDTGDSTAPDEVDKYHNNENLDELSRTAKQMTTQLEMAIIRAESQLKQEQSLLAEVTRQHNRPGTEKSSPQARLAALSKTRTELVRWIEEKLSTNNVEEMTTSRKPEEQRDAGLTDTEYRSRILEQYESYVGLRKTLLRNLKTAALPLPAVERAAQAPPKQANELAEKSAQQVDFTLSFIEAQTLNLSRAQQAKALSAVYASSELKKERAETLDVLGRLGEESHLLPSYPPQPAAQSHGKATLSNDEAQAYAEHWSSASHAARAETTSLVQEHIESGKKMARNAEETLRVLEDLLAANRELLI